MDDNTKQQLIDKISTSKTIAIFVSNKSKYDGLASGLAFYQVFTKINKKVSIYAPDPTVQDAKTLYAIDKINVEESNKNLIINVNNAVKNVEKISHYIENDKLKVVIHALPESKGIPQNDVSIETQSSNQELITDAGCHTLVASLISIGVLNLFKTSIPSANP